MKAQNRFIAMHNSEDGYETPDEVVRWISRQDRPLEYRIVEIIVDQITQDLVEYNTKRREDAAYAKGVKDAQDRIKEILGL